MNLFGDNWFIDDSESIFTVPVRSEEQALEKNIFFQQKGGHIFHISP